MRDSTLAGEESGDRGTGASAAEDAKRLANAQLTQELKGMDNDRAQRYVATVRPAMAAVRYVRPQSPQPDDHQHRTEEGDGGRSGNAEQTAPETDLAIRDRAFATLPNASYTSSSSPPSSNANSSNIDLPIVATLDEECRAQRQR
ncbi:hypothetical protein PR003_g567 [Phytophthora rubi]|uniref:Uncharacterized protein n=1 Tax=Phytophthora rubi TaxID=129364 RepID=A0A6A3PG48_9STRA|nr:hypothetical protein PR001_g420 [Phytophthora rubi]KAE9359835.1 hypothetical protein PR003_g567 [Phytophthora rubi]